MSDVPSALGIEAVEFVAEGGRTVTVRVTGRWRRRRPELRGQAMLVVENGTARQRFVAMPEPPSLLGAAPGTWRMSFTVPVELAPQLPGKTFLQLGAVMVPLPIGDVVVPGGGQGADGDGLPEGPKPELLEARELRSSELAAESARRRAADAEAAVGALHAQVARIDDELMRARDEADRLRDEIAERERRLRSSEQHGHAERARRVEVEQALTEKTRAATHDLRVLHEHVADLERELRRMRRAVDEAHHLAAVAEAGRAAAEAERASDEAGRAAAEAGRASDEAGRAAAEAGRADAERRLAERPPAAPEPAPAERPSSVAQARAARITSELVLARATATATGPGAAAPAPPIAPARAGDSAALRLESAMVEHRATGLERELAEARDELAGACRDLANARRELQRQRVLCERAYDAIDRVRGELTRLGGDVPAEPVVRASAPPSPVQAEKLSAALARLREGTPPAAVQEPAAEAATPPPERPTESAAHPERPPKPWLGKTFRTLVGRDPSVAGRLLLALLPAQRAADPSPVAYDLVLGDLATARVTVSSTTTQVDLGDTPRPLTEVDFQLVGDLASIARLLAAGPVRRRLGRLPMGGRLARVRGDRRRLGALEALLDAPLTLGRLHAAGVRIDPLLALTVAAIMIEPGWTAGERFTIAHRDPPAPAPDAYLHIRDARAPMAAEEPPHGPVAATIECPPDELLAVLAGEQVAFVAISDAQRSLALIRRWLDRAQCG